MVMVISGYAVGTDTVHGEFRRDPGKETDGVQTGMHVKGDPSARKRERQVISLGFRPADDERLALIFLKTANRVDSEFVPLLLRNGGVYKFVRVQFRIHVAQQFVEIGFRHSRNRA